MTRTNDHRPLVQKRVGASPITDPSVAALRQGYEDAREGRPFQYDVDTRQGVSASYEHGRQAALNIRLTGAVPPPWPARRLLPACVADATSLAIVLAGPACPHECRAEGPAE